MPKATMSLPLPPRFLFRWSFVIPYRKDLPAANELLLGSDVQLCLPSLAEFDHRAEWTRWRAGWNQKGLGLAVTVSGKSKPPSPDPNTPLTGDVVQIWLDTRCTQNIHRATRYCQSFLVFPAGKRRGSERPMIQRQPIPQARETANPPEASPELSCCLLDDGYRLDIWFPAGSLIGYDPKNHQRLGFFAAVHDRELGSQTLTVGDEFSFATDPSLWTVLELQPET
jgi:hypothetical protein